MIKNAIAATLAGLLLASVAWALSVENRVSTSAAQTSEVLNRLNRIENKLDRVIEGR